MIPKSITMCNSTTEAIIYNPFLFFLFFNIGGQFQVYKDIWMITREHFQSVLLYIKHSDELFGIKVIHNQDYYNIPIKWV